ncbi:unnamed protein product [Lactuca virosa]|uniref:Uncharacterized protein n=1 Tax=Lactuca virosa TaxID=75947 RepID=A0AAU9LSP4_9ASTR|nr:unnamed protein product [Lactuca virosa]
MCEQGFDTWILEVRGAGLSMHGSHPKDIEQSAHAISNQMEAVAVSGAETVLSASQSSSTNTTESPIPLESEIPVELPTVWEESILVTKLTETFITLSDRVSGFLSEGLLELKQTSTVASQIQDLSQKLINIIEEGQRSVSPPLFDLQERLTTTMEDFQKQLDMIVKYDWDFDHYLEEDVPAAVR